MSNIDKRRSLENISDEEIGRILAERDGGRIAGRGDSPCTQEFYEKEYGLNPEKRDWILSTIIGASFYDTKWFLDYGKSVMKPLVRKYSLPRELVIKADELRLCIGTFGEGIETHMNRIGYIVRESMRNGWNSRYETEAVSANDLAFSPEDRRKFSGQARIRFKNRIGRLEKFKSREDEGDEYYLERTMARLTVFEAAYLCLRSESPEETCELFRQTVRAQGTILPVIETEEI